MHGNRQGLVLVGLGPYARSFYYPALERLSAEGRVRVDAVIDVTARRKDVTDYLRDRAVRPREVLLLEDPPDSEIAARDLPALDRVARDSWGCVVATEPRWHRAYTEWALTRGLHVLLEKPITARDFAGGRSRPEDLRADFEALTAMSASTCRAVVVQTQRRVHPAYVAMRTWVREIVETYDVPLTHVGLSHADGSWNMPWEFESRDNHPHRYGYGKLLHSGYHLLDALSWLEEVNDATPNPPDSAELTTLSVGPRDLAAQLGDGAYAKLFGASFAASGRATERVPDERFGETDVVLAVSFASGSRVVSTSAITLLQTAFSRRISPELPVDTYKGNGRVRHESVTLQVGPLAAVQAASFSDGEGGDEFVVRYFRNRGLIGGESSRVERFGPDDGRRSLNDQARSELLEDFLATRDDRSGIAKHARGIDLLIAAVESVAARKAAAGGGIGATQRIAW
jgi:predicted dehydrogenase